MSRWKMTIGLRAFLLVTTMGTAVCCVVFLWYRRAAEEAATVDWLRRGGHRVYYECDLRPGGKLPMRDRTQFERLVSIMGDSAFFDVELVIMRDDARDDEIEMVSTFTALKQLSATSTLVTDQGTTSLTHLTMLRRLSLQSLNGSRVTDAGVRNIAQLKDLEELLLTGAAITDGSVPLLARLTKLRTLGVGDTEVSEDGLRRLRQALPETNVRGGQRTHERARGEGS